MRKDNNGRGGLSASAATGVIALVFLAIGWQTALFVHKAATARVLAGRDRPDTVYIVRESPAQPGSSAWDGLPQDASRAYIREYSARPEAVRKARETYAKRTYESFPFDPNTATVEELMRLGFSRAQAEAIDRYRRSGGHFSRAADFAKSYVVDDSVFRRLEPWINIPKLDLNTADSAALDRLPGIGPYYAARIVSYRKELGGYSYPAQLMDLPRFDSLKYAALSDLVFAGQAEGFALWTLPADSLSQHPYIDAHAARGIVLFRENNPVSALTVSNLIKNGVLDRENGEKLMRCRIKKPPHGD